MTNAEKYLKEEQFIFDISKGIAEAICYDDMEQLKNITEKEIRNWFTNNIKPTLTEDERVILRNIDKKYKYISKGKGDTELYLKEEADDNCSYIFRGFTHLFQFIKERRRILNRGTFERRII